jgi:sugar phosphate isomerase/epimerase
MKQLMGIGDEAGESLESQIAATLELEWSHIEMRTVLVGDFQKGNIHDIPDPAFDLVLRKLELAGVKAYCFGSTIMNWSRRVEDPFEPTIAEVRRAIPRMQRLGTKFVRIMSFKPGEDEFRIPAEVFRRVKEIVVRFTDAGLQPVHENCMNYGGMSWQHALELLDKCPGLKWAYDTGNPLFNLDRAKTKPWPRQDPWEFWQNIRDHVAHIHVKDASWNAEKNAPDYTWPGEGECKVLEILRDASSRGYAGGFSIEPHMVSVLHDPSKTEGKPPDDKQKRRNFVDYGRLLQELLEQHA